MRTKCLLIIDDDVELCEELAESFRNEGYAVTCSSDPSKADGLIRDLENGTILLDYKMPEITGIDILKKLKADNIRKRIFIFSGRPDVRRLLYEEDLLDMVAGIIKKPGDFKTILKTVAT